MPYLFYKSNQLFVHDIKKYVRTSKAYIRKMTDFQMQ
jgi:hypothetical protein